MNWRTFGEITAVLSVVLSLIFVGLELRASSAIARSEAYNTFSIRLSEVAEYMASNPEMTELVVRANGGELPSDFSEVENYQMRNNYTALIRVWEGLFRTVEEGILTPDYLEIMGQGGAFNSDYFREVWHSAIKFAYTDSFVEYFESLAWNQVNPN